MRVAVGGSISIVFVGKRHIFCGELLAIVPGDVIAERHGPGSRVRARRGLRREPWDRLLRVRIQKERVVDEVRELGVEARRRPEAIWGKVALISFGRDGEPLYLRSEER